MDNIRVPEFRKAKNVAPKLSRLGNTLRAYADKAPKVTHVLEEGFDDVTAVLALPERYRRRLRTTNSVERLNEEIRRRERVIRIFPNRQSALRLLGALLMEMDEKWTTGHRYLDMQDYWEWRKSQATVVKQLA